MTCYALWCVVKPFSFSIDLLCLLWFSLIFTFVDDDVYFNLHFGIPLVLHCLIFSISQLYLSLLFKSEQVKGKHLNYLKIACVYFHVLRYTFTESDKDYAILLFFYMYSKFDKISTQLV